MLWSEPSVFFLEFQIHPLSVCLTLFQMCYYEQNQNFHVSKFFHIHLLFKTPKKGIFQIFHFLYFTLWFIGSNIAGPFLLCNFMNQPLSVGYVDHSECHKFSYILIFLFCYVLIQKKKLSCWYYFCNYLFISRSIFTKDSF